MFNLQETFNNEGPGDEPQRGTSTSKKKLPLKRKTIIKGKIGHLLEIRIRKKGQLLGSVNKQEVKCLLKKQNPQSDDTESDEYVSKNTRRVVYAINKLASCNNL